MPSHIRISWKRLNFPRVRIERGRVRRGPLPPSFDSPPGDQRVAPVDPAERCSAKAKEPPTPRFGNAPWFGKEDDHGDTPWHDAEAEAEDLIHILGEGRVLGRMG